MWEELVVWDIPSGPHGLVLGKSQLPFVNIIVRLLENSGSTCDFI